jgi:hypothetical protein
MKIITKYIADDGVEFTDIDECTSHENNTHDIHAKVNELRENPSEALIALMTGIRDKLGIDLVSYNGYVKIFKNHQPCAHHCTLWRQIADYGHDYPTILSLYNELIDDYIALYGDKQLS